MKADLTRDSFDPQKHFSRVLMQQGRVQLDADWNEQGALLLHATRQLARDVAPAGGAVDSPFALTPMAAPHADDLEIAPGTLYVDGIACNAAATVIPVVHEEADGDVVATWTADGQTFQVGQMLRTDWDPATNLHTLVTITGVDMARHKLMLDHLNFGRPAAKGVEYLLRFRRVPTYLTQPDLPHPPTLPLVPAQFYLDVWERLVTPIEDDSIREVALDGASTADRARIVCQLKWLAIPDTLLTTACVTPGWISHAIRGGYPGTLRARVRPAPNSTDPCTASPGAPYRGAENQLYRVEVNTGTLDDQGARRPATFKWSRDNGAVTFAVKSVQVGTTTTTVRLESLGPDDRFGIDQGQLVELADDESTLKQRPGQLLRVQSVDRPGKVVVLAGALAADGTRVVGTDSALHPLLRRWDHGRVTDSADAPDLAADGCLPIVPASILDGDAAWGPLEDGVEVLFENFDPNASYRPGDYWLIPARVATADLIWPQEDGLDADGKAVTYPAARGPSGIEHHYAPLAVFNPQAAQPVTPCQAARSAVRKKNP